MCVSHACSRREQVAQTPAFYPASAWWFFAALSRGMLESLGRKWLAKLSLSVFAQRAKYAHQVRRAVKTSAVASPQSHISTISLHRDVLSCIHHALAQP